MATKDPKTLVGYLNEHASDAAEIEISTGNVLRGRLSPYADDAEFVRLNADDGGRDHIILKAPHCPGASDRCARAHG